VQVEELKLVRILVVGSGGREHAIAWKLAADPRVGELLIAPGNAGTRALGENVPIPASDTAGLVGMGGSRHVDLVVVGPEVPLAMGLVDELERVGIPAFGPSRAAARLESSKSFAHAIMHKCGVPCAASRVFSEIEAALEHVASLQPPIVVKADGLAAGKGVLIAGTLQEAFDALNDILVRRVFGAAGDKVVIEEYLSGREVSLLAFTDGVHVAPMVPSCDYKRAMDGDQGLNTGGMGCYTPPGFFDRTLAARATEVAIRPVIRALADEGTPYRGVIYAGLMVDGEAIRVLEFNARFGDPETQVILPRLESDLAVILTACAEGSLDPEMLRWRPGCSVGVVMASGGYPGDYQAGFPVHGLDAESRDVVVFHAGTGLDDAGRVVTAGGRVLNVVATGETMAEARERVYGHIARLSFEGAMYRTDIALREVA
jgi:phosphoribosylamine---glycine ligase